MFMTTPLLVSPKGGFITCFKGDHGRIFLSCSRERCVYSSDLHSAKAHLDNLEYESKAIAIENNKIPAQRKTTLKWTSDGELSAVDMARILDRLSNQSLTTCELSCDIEDYSSNNQENFFRMSLPVSSWIP